MSLRLKWSFQHLHFLCSDSVSTQVNSVKLKHSFLLFLSPTKTQQTQVHSKGSFIIIYASFAFTITLASSINKDNLCIINLILYVIILCLRKNTTKNKYIK